MDLKLYTCYSLHTVNVNGVDYTLLLLSFMLSQLLLRRLLLLEIGSDVVP